MEIAWIMNERACWAGLASNGTELTLYYIEIFVFARSFIPECDANRDS
jgi:hypothetical protein